MQKCPNKVTTSTVADAEESIGAGSDTLLPTTLATAPNAVTMGNRRRRSADSDESTAKPYPKAVFFMLGNEFCERFSFYGMRAILTLYFITEHQYSDSTASLIYHAFIATAYFSPLLGSILADNFFGRFNVILYVSVVYVLGHVLLSIGAIPDLATGLRTMFDFGGLFIIALATGGIKPCVAAFAADQFPPDQRRQREQFFSFFYFSINAGSLLAILTTPLLRGRVKCLGSQYCFPLAFGVPGVLMLLALLIFIAGWRTYRRIAVAEGNVVYGVVGCITLAVKNKLAAVCSRQPQKRENAADESDDKRTTVVTARRGSSSHWLDVARPQYGDELVDGVRSMLAVIMLFLPVVFYWALFDQLGSTWVLQARRMTGRVGPVTILPDQMQLSNAVFILILVPIFESCIYPLVRRTGLLLTPLRKMGIGGMMAAVSFVLAGLLQLKVNETMVVVPGEGLASLSIVDLSPASCRGELSSLHTSQPVAGSAPANVGARVFHPLSNTSLPIMLPADTYKMVVSGDCTLTQAHNGTQVQITIRQQTGYLIVLFGKDGVVEPVVLEYELDKVPNGNTKIHAITSPFFAPLVGEGGGNYEVQADDGHGTVFTAPLIPGQPSALTIAPAVFSSEQYRVMVASENAVGRRVFEISANYSAYTGAADVLLVDAVNNGNNNDDNNNDGVDDDGSLVHRPPTAFELIPLIRGNTVHLFWQIPQFLCMTIGEVLFSITGLEFSYSQAQPNMKSVLQAIWLMTVAFGNCIDMVISGAHLVAEPATEFFVYAALMASVMLLFIVLARRYTYVDNDVTAEAAADAAGGEGVGGSHTAIGPYDRRRSRSSSLLLVNPPSPPYSSQFHKKHSQNLL